MESAVNTGARTVRAKKDNIFVRLGRDIAKNKGGYLFMLPFGIIFIVFTILPVVISIILSFTNFNVLQPPTFAALDNYAKMLFKDTVFRKAMQNTFIIASIVGPFSYIASLIFAWFINELPPKLRALMTLIFYAPSISGAVYMVWPMIFSGDANGYVNELLMRFGIIHEAKLWFTDVETMMPMVVIVLLWISLGAGFLSFIAGLQSVDKSLYEAGAIDGIKNRYQELWFITLPTIRPQLMFGAVMSITGAFGVGPVITQLVGYPSTDYHVQTMVLHMQDYGNTRFEMGYACAMATVLFLIMIICNKLIQLLLRKVGE